MPRRVPRKNRNIRVEDALWSDVLKIAKERDEVLAEVIRAALARYREEHRHLLKDDETR